MKLKTLIDEAAKVCGSERKLAAALGENATHPNDWKHERRSCPDKAIIAMARIAGRDPMRTALEVYRERLGKLVTTSQHGVVAIFSSSGASGLALVAAYEGATMYSASTRADRRCASNDRRAA